MLEIKEYVGSKIKKVKENTNKTKKNIKKDIKK